jgi:hypothetical protein
MPRCFQSPGLGRRYGVQHQRQPLGSSEHQGSGILCRSSPLTPSHLAKRPGKPNGRKFKDYKGRSEADDPAPREQAGTDARTGILVMERRVVESGKRDARAGNIARARAEQDKGAATVTARRAGSRPP